MSSANRGYNRHSKDYYKTPIRMIEYFLPFLLEEIDIKKDTLILDPCAGGDGKYPMSYPTALNNFGFNNIETIDIRNNSRAEYKMDYIDCSLGSEPDIIITNPPFDISLDIIKKALEDVKDGGYVIMLLRLNYFGTKIRKPFWDKYMPKYCFVYHERISFVGKTVDSIEYAHFVWQKGNYPKFTNLRVI